MIKKLKTHLKNVKIFIFLVCVFSICFLVFNFAEAKPISSSELIEHAKDYDGKIVSFQGEAIGDIMKRGNFAWINVNDGQNAIGIWLPLALTREINYTGGYKSVGDTVLIKGKFQRACTTHGGDLDVHADSLLIIKEGNSVAENINTQKFKSAVGFLGVVLCFGILRLLKRKPKKK